MAMDAPHYAPVSEPRSEQPLKLFVGQVGGLVHRVPRGRAWWPSRYRGSG